MGSGLGALAALSVSLDLCLQKAVKAVKTVKSVKGASITNTVRYSATSPDKLSVADLQ